MPLAAVLARQWIERESMLHALSYYLRGRIQGSSSPASSKAFFGFCHATHHCCHGLQQQQEQQ
jgi:hypothetical protein